MHFGWSADEPAGTGECKRMNQGKGRNVWERGHGRRGIGEFAATSTNIRQQRSQGGLEGGAGPGNEQIKKLPAPYAATAVPKWADIREEAGCFGWAGPRGKEVAKAAAVAGVGAGVGGAGGGTVGVLELAAQGAATGLSAGLAIGVGAAAGAALFLLGYKALKNRKKKADA